MKNVSPEVLKRTRNLGAALYWVSLITNMAVLGFSVPHFLNKFLRHSVQKDKLKEQSGNNSLITNYKNVLDFMNKSNT